jgi:RHS repeat-associated protein
MDNEPYGQGNEYDYGFRIYNPRIGRFLSVDPIADQYPWYTPYQFGGNTPIQAIDLDGMEEYVVTNYLNKYRQIQQTSITLINEKDNNTVVNMQLVTSSGEKVSPNHNVLVRNINNKGKLISYERKQLLNLRELNVLKTGRREPVNDPPYNPFAIEFTDGQYLTTESESFTDNKYDAYTASKQFHPEPPAPPIPANTIMTGFQGSNNYYVGITPFVGAGNLGDILTKQIEKIAKGLNNVNSNIKTVTVSVTQVVGTVASSTEVSEAQRQVNTVINNIITLLKNNTKGKNINFVNGGAHVLQTDKNPSQVPNAGTTIKFDK